MGWGRLATFHVLDTRQHRSDQIDPCPVSERVSGYCAPALDPTRSILGAEQRDWLLDGLGTSGTAWNVIANQVPFAPWERDLSPLVKRFDRDQWDGYVADRQLVLDYLADNSLLNTIAITGDSHIHSARNVPRQYSELDGPTIATEFIGSAITSDGDPPNPDSTFAGDANNPHFQFTNRRKGYVKVLLEPGLWTNEFRVIGTVNDPASPVSTEATFVVVNGSPGAVRA
jgi:alkaline phosphatase D